MYVPTVDCVSSVSVMQGRAELCKVAFRGGNWLHRAEMRGYMYGIKGMKCCLRSLTEFGMPCGHPTVRLPSGQRACQVELPGSGKSSGLRPVPVPPRHA
jgi:hypothetical protein